MHFTSSSSSCLTLLCSVSVSVQKLPGKSCYIMYEFWQDRISWMRLVQCVCVSLLDIGRLFGTFVLLDGNVPPPVRMSRWPISVHTQNTHTDTKVILKWFYLHTYIPYT